VTIVFKTSNANAKPSFYKQISVPISCGKNLCTPYISGIAQFFICDKVCPASAEWELRRNFSAGAFYPPDPLRTKLLVSHDLIAPETVVPLMMTACDSLKGP
jgi:hypothetical protein